MEYKLIKLDGTPFTEDDINIYINKTVDRLFAVLVTYEECEKINSFVNYKTYVKRLITEFNGIQAFIEKDQFISMVGLLSGMILDDSISHDEVKSNTFHCIGIVKSALNSQKKV